MKTKMLNSMCCAAGLQIGPTMFAALCALSLALPARGQNFDVGSDGSLGDVIVTNDTTMDLPTNGVLNFKSLTVNSGGTLGFNRNALNTPVYILAQTEVVVNGTINVDGSAQIVNTGGIGGPGGFDGGKPGFGTDTPPGDGYGPGGGHAGPDNCNDSATTAVGAGYGTRRSSFSGDLYGNALLIPLVGGSGGGGVAGNVNGGGGGGGGAILIAANNRVAVAGSILARGGNGGGCINGGSGGAIRLVSFKVEGAGTLDARSQGNAGSGRIRVDTVIRTGVKFNTTGITTVGGNLLVFPPTIPKLAVTEAGGNAIPEGSDPVVFTLPFGADTNQTVRIQARDFGRNVPIRVTLTPDSGAKRVFDAEVDNSAVNPAVVDVPVTVPINTVVTVHCWTR